VPNFRPLRRSMWFGPSRFAATSAALPHARDACGWVLLLLRAIGIAAVLCNWISDVARIPAAVAPFVAEAAMVKIVPDVHAPSGRTVRRRWVRVVGLCRERR
jgi:hypothetical protein